MTVDDATVILGIETSCDETAAAVVMGGNDVLSSVVATQIEEHARFGGVVPEVASRAHLESIVPVVRQAFDEAGILPSRVDLVAATAGPGLIGALLVGVSAAKSLALAWDKPFIGVNHLEAHLYAGLLDDPTLEFPLVVLLVSGGHTMIIEMRGHGDYTILGRTIDDAAGEAYDKVAKLLGLGYPGGPVIDRLARGGNDRAVALPKTRLTHADRNAPHLSGRRDFSFSGLKTAILYFLQNAGRSQVYKEEWIATQEEQQKFIQDNLNDLCASIQERIISILLNKLKKASKQTGIKEICIAGGVSANSGLRKALRKWGETNGWKTYIPAFMYCTDNAGMIAITGYYKFLEGKFDELNIPVTARTDMNFS